MLIPLCFFVALATLVSGQEYGATLVEGDLSLPRKRALLPFEIPDGECTLDIRMEELGCMVMGVAFPPRAIEVKVDDAVKYPEITMDLDEQDDFKSVSIWRVAPCDGPAQVSVKVACDIYPQQRFQSRSRPRY